MAAAAPGPMKNLARDATVLAVAAVLTQGAGMVATIVLAHLLSLGEFGHFQQLLLLYGIVAPLLYGGIPAALTYELARARGDEERRAAVFVATVALGGLGAMFAVLLVVLREPLAAVLQQKGELSTAIALLAPYALLTFIAATMSNALIPVNRARLSALLSAASALVYVVCVIGAAMIAGDVEGLALGMGLSSAFSATVAVVAIRRTIGYRIEWDGLLTRIRRFLAYGIPLALTGLAGLLGFQFDRLVVTHQFSADLFAIYAVGAVELPISMIVQQSVNSVLLPELALMFRDGNTAGMAALWRETIRKTSLVLLPVFVLCMVFADDLMRVAFGARFDRSVEIFRIYLLLMPLRVATYGLIPMAIGRTRINMVASLVVLGSNVVLAIALVGPLGLNGPAWASVIATVLTVTYYLLRLRQPLSLPISSLMPWRLLAGNLLVAAVAVAPVALIHMTDLPSGVRLGVGTLLYAVLVVPALRLTRRITDEDWRRVVALLHRLRPARDAG